MSHGHTHKPRSKKTNIKRHFEIRESETDEAYLMIQKSLGNCSFSCINKNTGEEVFAKTANRLTKGPHRKFINIGDLVLAEVIHITANKDQYMIKHVYTADEASKLQKMGELENHNVDPDKAKASVIFEKDQQQLIAMEETEINIDDI